MVEECERTVLAQFGGVAGLHSLPLFAVSLSRIGLKAGQTNKNNLHNYKVVRRRSIRRKINGGETSSEIAGTRSNRDKKVGEGDVTGSLAGGKASAMQGVGDVHSTQAFNVPARFGGPDVSGNEWSWMK